MSTKNLLTKNKLNKLNFFVLFFIFVFVFFFFISSENNFRNKLYPTKLSVMTQGKVLAIAALYLKRTSHN